MARAKSRKLHGLPHAIMSLAGGIGDHLRIDCAQAVQSDVIVAIGLVTRHKQRQKIRHGRAGDENTAGLIWKVEGLRHPAGNLFLDSDGDMIAAAAIRIHPCRKHLGDHANRRAGALSPAHEHGMDIACGEGLDETIKVLKHSRKIPPILRQLAVKARLSLIAWRKPYRPLSDVS